MEFLELLKLRTVRAHNGQKSKKIKPSDDSLRSAISWPPEGVSCGLSHWLISCVPVFGNDIGQMGPRRIMSLHEWHFGDEIAFAGGGWEWETGSCRKLYESFNLQEANLSEESASLNFSKISKRS